MPRDEHGKLLMDKFAGTANPAENAALGSFPFSEGWDENYWPPETGRISGPVVNAILRRISAVGVEINLNGVLEWDTSISYNDNAIVLGSDGVLYQSQQASNSAHNPTTDTSNTYWAPLPDRYLATVAEAQAGTDPDKLMAPLTVRAAITALLASVAEAQAGTDPAKLMTPLRVRQAITEILATAAQARAGNDNDVLMTPLRVQDAVTALLASVAEAQAGTDPAKLMTPLRVRQSITEILATAAQARTGTDPTRLMTPERVRESITAILATQAEAEAGSAPDKLMTPLRVKNYIDRKPASVSRHDSPVITLDAATGSVVDTSTTLGISVAKDFQPLLVAARARGGYSVNDEVAVGYQLADGVDVKIRKINTTSFAVHCPAGDIHIPIIGDPNGLYMFSQNTNGPVASIALPVPTSGFSLNSVGNSGQSVAGSTYWPVSGEEKIYVVTYHNYHLYEILNPRVPADARDLGRLPSTLIDALLAVAAHEVSDEMRLYAIGAGHQLYRVNPDDPDDTTGNYGRVSGNLTVTGPGGYQGMTSHGDPPVLYGVFSGSGSHRLVRINTTTPASSVVLPGDLPVQGIANTLFSDGTSLYYSTTTSISTTLSYLYRITSLTPTVTATLVGNVTGMAGIRGACVVSNFPRNQRMSLGSNGAAVDWNLKIRYAA